MVSMQNTVYVDDIREIKEENPFESMMSRFDRAIGHQRRYTRRSLGDTLTTAPGLPSQTLCP